MVHAEPWPTLEHMFEQVRVLTGDPERVKYLLEQWNHHGWRLVSAGYDQDGSLRTAIVGKTPPE